MKLETQLQLHWKPISFHLTNKCKNKHFAPRTTALVDCDVVLGINQ